MGRRENIGLRPLEALYLLSLGKQEFYSLKHALICMLISLYKEQLLLISRKKISLSKRGRYIIQNNQELDDLEKKICCALDKEEPILAVQAINKYDPRTSLLTKGMIEEKKLNLFSLFLSSKRRYIISALGQAKIDELKKIRLGKSKHTTKLVFPSIVDLTNVKMILIRFYVENLIKEYEKGSLARLYRGRQYL